MTVAASPGREEDSSLNSSAVTTVQGDSLSSWRSSGAAVLIGIVLLGAGLRLNNLGLRSLWADEFCTWRVSQMPFGESLRWGPELTKPPLYQLCVRAISSEEKPSEIVLRLPAAVAGILTIVAVGWLGVMAGGWTVGCAAALLIACNGLQIDYSQEARSYSMFVLGSVLSTGLWYRLIANHFSPRRKGNAARIDTGSASTRTRTLWGFGTSYVIVTVLAFHAHFLMLLTVAAQAIWWVVRPCRSPILRSSSKTETDIPRERRFVGPILMCVSGLLCVPVVWHYFCCRTSTYQGLDWINPPAWRDAVSVLEQLTFGSVWVGGLLLSSVVILVIPMSLGATLRLSEVGDAFRLCLKTPSPCQGEGWGDGRKCENHPSPGLSPQGERCFETQPSSQRRYSVRTSLNRLIDARACDSCKLLLIWLGTAWFGLMVISWLAHPAMVARYALPAAVPAILLPLILAGRFDARAPLVIAAVFCIGSAGQWGARSEKIMPGFREMVTFLNEVVDPRREAVAVVIDRATSPGWEEMDRLGFEYYPLRSTELHDLYLRDGQLDGDQLILNDPRALYLVTFLADPVKAIESAGRSMGRIRIDDRSFEQLLFTPYRLQLVSPRD